MNPKKMFQAITDQNLSLQERLFRLLSMIGLCGLAVGIAGGIAAGEGGVNLIPLSVACVAFMGIACYFIHCHKIQTGAVSIAVVIIYFVLPYNFLTSGGIYGGGPIWFLFGIFYVCLVVEGKVKYFFLGSSLAVITVCYYVAYFYPTWVVQHTLEMAYVDSFMTLAIVAALTCGMILFQNAIYRSENLVAQNRQKEIEKLNRIQNNFFSSMSHEIRTPINTIIGLNEMILREDVSDEVAADAKSIQGASKMLLALINDILDMSKMEAGKMDIIPAEYDVGAMLSDIVNMIWARAKEKGLQFHIDVDSSTPAHLIGDEVRIKQVLVNVLNNAVKYTSEGSVTLAIQCKSMDNGYAQISYSVTDTGMGIKKENIPYLFDAFRRVDEERNRYIEGTGLGLSIVKQLVELMGGDIAVNSVYTKGSTFMITLPQKVAGEERISGFDLERRRELSAREHYKQSFEAPRAQVLIVDDNEANLMVAEKLLRDTKVKIDTVLSGEECLRRTFQNRYDVIFMDHLMPGMDGIECLHAIRAQTGGLNLNTPVVILTANAGGENQVIYRREGFSGYLLKPVSGIQLETELLKHLPRELVSITNTEDFDGTEETLLLAHKTKLPVMISTDSVSDLPQHLVKKNQVAVMPYRVVTEGGEFLDGVETETDGLLSYIGERGKRVRSEAPKTADYEEFFADQLLKAQYIVHISMARNVSKGYANALEASKTFDNVIVVDSGHLSSGMGLMVLRAAEYAAAGLPAEAIRKELEQMRRLVRTSFIVESTEYLARSGRISSRIHTICEAFLLHPVIVLKNSSMTVGAIRMGTRDYARKKYVASMLKDMHQADRKILFITYAGLNRGQLKEIEEQVKEKMQFEHVIYQKASPAISTNCGPGSFGLLFVLKGNDI